MFAPCLIALLLLDKTAALVSPDGTGRLPAMGWNSWNEYGCNITEDVFLKVGQQLVTLGLRDLGYRYVNIDDCWSDKQRRRDLVTKEIVPDSAKFPQGIAHTARLIHELGLKIGIYSDAGTDTCGGYAGSLGYEEIDAATFSKWEIDYLKYDNCNVPPELTDQFQFAPEGPADNAPEGYDWGSSNTSRRYKTMRDALLAQNRTLQYSLCAWGHARVERWGNATGHSWRMWGDIMPRWAGKEQWSWGLMPIVNQASRLWNATDFWGHSDWDMLEVGNGNLTIEENRSHFAMWCALKSPLIIGTRLEDISKPVLDILSNKELIAFNQDPVYGASAMPFKQGYSENGVADPMLHPAEYWVGTSTKGIHLFLLNTQDGPVEMRALVSEIPPLRNGSSVEYLLHDMWTGRDLGRSWGEVRVRVAGHDTAALRINAVDGTHPNVKWKSAETNGEAVMQPIAG